MKPDNEILRKELEDDLKLESRLFMKELLVILALLLLTWCRETFLHGWL